MEPVRRAVIDIGTNSVKLLVAEVSCAEVRPLWEESHQTRLGQGFYDTHRLQPGPIEATAAAVAEFAARAKARRAESIRVIATSAARDAVNATELSQAVAEAAGLAIEIISGAQEAEWAYRGATTDARWAAQPLLLLDVGGGSSEFTLGDGRKIQFARSFPMGTVRLLERLSLDDPPTDRQFAECRGSIAEFFRREVEPGLKPALRQAREQADGRGVELVGTGGTASVLGCMEAGLESFNRELLEATTLTTERVAWHAARLWALPLEERRKLPGLPKNRADVILTGVAIYLTVIKETGFAKLHVTTRGLRFAALL